MKIKCPIFDKLDATHPREFENSTSLFRHLMDEHTNHSVSSHYAVLIFKIHEKIEELENAEVRTHGLSRILGEIEVLKSLLEGEKQ